MTIRLPKDEDKHISGTDDIARIMLKILWRQNKIHRKKEYFWTVGLNTANDIDYIELVTIGTSNRNIAEPVDILSLPVSKKCKKIILCHNHPSGKLEPSEQDILFTERITKAAAILGIEVLDHLIITENNYVTIDL
ncbi:JAB domain-containing protein [Flagellimonas myxillae]|uniref:JAB domain-containing protein n=1 Tax=Flagellimonas myxillae TaxID=2942214 RepID=UPI00201FA792|nr:JAB domain-containing protein [Muricauda myxillae]MCL6267443.1 JAB domain-containing protein [Muricauda myxillae]